MHINMKKGFTLIELMVVISIIAILAAIILSALSVARSQGRNGNIQEEVTSLRNQIELSYNGSYYAGLTANTTCSNYLASVPASQTDEMAIINQITAQNGGVFASTTGGYANPNPIGVIIVTNAVNTVTVCGQPSTVPTQYAIYATYTSTKGVGTAGYLCVDSTGKNISSTANITPTWYTSQNNAKGSCI